VSTEGERGAGASLPAPKRRRSKVKLMASVIIIVLGVLCLLALVAAIAIRRASDDPAVWHIDPLTSTSTGNPNWYRLVPPEADVDRDPKRDGEAPVYTQSSAEVAAAFDAFARAESNVEVLAGSAADGFVTYIQRSTLFGFPDYMSVKFFDRADGGSSIAIFSRARYGRSDLDVNEKRVVRWIDGTTAALR
jgi:hypothetical protein